MSNDEKTHLVAKCDTLLQASYIVTQNKGREILENSSIAIKDGKICDIGSTSILTQKWQAKRTLDFSNMLLMPGLINAHTHAAMTFLRGLADDMPLMSWLQNKIWPVEAKLDAEIVRLGCLLGQAEMLSSGTTAFSDMYIFEQSTFDAAEISGIRCNGGETVFVFPSAACADYHVALDKTREYFDRYAGNEKIKISVEPHAVYTTNSEILTACRELALELDIPIHIHLSETEGESKNCVAEHGMRPIAWCNANGLFDCKVVAAHLVDVNDEEAEILASKKVSAVHNPSSNMKLASGVSPVKMMLEANVSVALGTDGAASNNNLNMFTEMRLAALLQKLVCKDTSVLPAQTVLDMATIGGSEAFGDSHLGSLQVGYSADCVALDLSGPNMLPLYNPTSHIVYATSGHECRMTMIAGEIVYQDGKFTRFDYEALIKECDKLHDFAVRYSS